MKPVIRRLLHLTMLTLLATAAPVSASGLDVIRDCTDDEVMSKTYTQKEYRDALRQFAADGDQYGNCRDVIRRAQAAAAAARQKPAGGTGNDAGGAAAGAAPPSGGAGAIGSAPAAEQLRSATAAERRAVQSARATPAGADTIDAAKVGTAPGVSSAADLPTPLVILLALLLAGALAVAGLRVRRLVNARRA